MNNKKVEISDMYCTYCGNRGITVPRRKGTQREPGHLKKLFCIYCNTSRNHVEVRQGSRYTIEDFRFEYENHNFDSDGNRILTLKQLRRKQKWQSYM